MSPEHQPLSDRDRQMVASMPGATTCYVDLILLDPEGEFAGWEQRTSEVFLMRELDYEREGKHLCVLPPAACVAWVEERERKYVRMLAAGYTIRVRYHWNEFEQVPLEVYEAMRRERWRELEYQRTGRRTLTARKLEEKTIEMAIANLFSLELQASPASGMQEIQARLKQAYDIEFAQDAQNSAVYHVSRYSLPWQVFHTTRKIFKQPGDRWPWEEEPKPDA